MQDLTGQKFNMLTVLREDVEFNSIPRKGGYKKWICKCDCGNEKSVGAAHLKNGQTKSCGCLQKRKGSEHPLFNGAGEISGGFWYDKVMRRAKKSATHRAIEITITPEYAWNLFVSQGEKCALSGLPLKMNDDASLDRIDSSIGYVEGNVQWVHKDINIMKNKFNQDYFIDICKKIADSCTI